MPTRRPVRFTLPHCTNGKGWEKVLDTTLPEPDIGRVFEISEIYDTNSRSLQLFALRS